MTYKTQDDYPTIGINKIKDEVKAGKNSGEPRDLLGKGLPGYGSNGKAGTPSEAPNKGTKDPKISPKV